MKKALFSLALALVTSTASAACFLYQGQWQCPGEKGPCWAFNGKAYCQPKDGSRLVLPCENTSCLSERPIPIGLPPAPVNPPARIEAVIAPTDADGKPSKFVNVCGTGGCSVLPAPVVVTETAPAPPPAAYWVQPPPVRVPSAVVWGPYNGSGDWGFPSGPPLRHR